MAKEVMKKTAQYCLSFKNTGPDPTHKMQDAG